MTLDMSKARIFIRPGSTDLRKAVNGLTALVQGNIQQEPFSGNVYIFCNKGEETFKSGVVGPEGILAEPEAA
jgi:transposase